MNSPTVVVSQFKAFLPVCQLLQQQGVKFWGITPEWTQAMVNIDLSAKPLAQLLNGEIQDQAWTDAAKLVVAGTKSFAQNGLGSSAYQFMSDKASAFLGPRVYDLCVLIRALDRAKPNLVIVHNDVEAQTRAMALWAQVRGIPCFHVPHAIYQDVNREPPISDIHDIVTASHLGAAGQVQREWYEIRGGFNPQNIIETGLPQWDHWAKPNNLNRRNARIGLRLPEDAQVVVYASTWPQHTNKIGINDQWIWSYKAFLQVIKRLPNVEGVVKLHPNAGAQSHQWHAEMAKQFGVSVTLTAEHLPHCLYAADLLIAFGGSNVIIEGSHLSHLRLMTTHGYENEPVIDKVPLDAEGMLEAIQSSLSQPPKDTSAFRYRWAGECDGHNAERVASVAMELIYGR